MGGIDIEEAFLEGHRKATAKEWTENDQIHFEISLGHFKEFLKSEDERKQRLKEREAHELEKVRQLWGEELIIARENALRDFEVKYAELERENEELRKLIKAQKK